MMMARARASSCGASRSPAPPGSASAAGACALGGYVVHMNQRAKPEPQKIGGVYPPGDVRAVITILDPTKTKQLFPQSFSAPR